jgi:putative (di)nucleoside polyphosphate hydrolase
MCIDNDSQSREMHVKRNRSEQKNGATLDEMLRDPVVVAIMRADGVSIDDLKALMAKTGASPRDDGAASASGRSETGYRPGVGVVLVNAAGMVFVASRIDVPGKTWQMPQGGIEEGEEPIGAAKRELAEEIGTDMVAFMAESQNWLSYDLPETLRAKAWGGRFRGQRQKWFLAWFTGGDRDINLVAHENPEFLAWKWVPPAIVPNLAVAFKKALYRQVLAEFHAPIERILASGPPDAVKDDTA